MVIVRAVPPEPALHVANQFVHVVSFEKVLPWDQVSLDESSEPRQVALPLTVLAAISPGFAVDDFNLPSDERR